MDSADSSSAEVRLTALKAMRVAENCWPTELARGFAEVMEGKRGDPSAAVRAFIADAVPQKSPVKTKVNAQKAPVKREKERKKTENEKNEKTKIREEIEFSEPMYSLDEMIDEANVKGITILLKNESYDLFGKMSGIIAVMKNYMEEVFLEDENLFSILCKRYSTYLLPFLTEVIDSLPNKKKYGLKIIYELNGAFDELKIAKLCLSSKRDYVITYNLEIAEKYYQDLDFLCMAVSNAIINDMYKDNREKVISLLKRLYADHKTKCEGLMVSLSKQEKTMVLKDVINDIPELYFTFDLDYDLHTKLNQELVQLREGNDKIDVNLIEESMKSKSPPSILLTIAIIREYNGFNQQYFEYLMECSKNQDINVSTNSSQTLLLKAENGFISLNELLSYKNYTNTFFNILTLLIEKSDSQLIKQNIEAISNAIKNGIADFETKDSALNSLAKYCIITKEKASSICDLSKVNQCLLNSRISLNQ